MSSQKKILIATDNFFPRWDGIVRFLYEIVPYLKKFYDITILAPDFSDDFFTNDEEMAIFKKRFKGVKIVYFNTSKIYVNDFSFAKVNKETMKRYIKRSDLVWTHALGSIGSNAIDIAHELGVKSIHYTHSFTWELVDSVLNFPVLKQLTSYLSKYYVFKKYRKLDKIIVPYKDMIETFKELGVKTNYEVIPLGVNTNVFRRKGKIAKNALSVDGPSIGYCGRLAKEKNIDIVYQTFKKLKEDIPNLSLIILGSGLNKYEQIFSNDADVKFVKSTIFPQMIYRAMDVFLLPSYTETTSLTTLEAMSTKAVPVVSDVGYLGNYVENDYNGYIVDLKKISKEEAIDIFSKKSKLILNNKSLKDRLSRNARKTVKLNFNIDQTKRMINDMLSNYLK
ncbi:MAG: glycosyltransferase family 4 protein [Candidatus Woesearchaeota archaeon]